MFLPSSSFRLGPFSLHQIEIQLLSTEVAYKDMRHDLCITPLARPKNSRLGEVLGDRRAVISCCDVGNSLHQVQTTFDRESVMSLDVDVVYKCCGHPQAIRIAQLLFDLMSLQWSIHQPAAAFPSLEVSLPPSRVRFSLDPCLLPG